MEEFWSGSLRPDHDEDENNPGSNVDILVRRDTIGIGVIHNPTGCQAKHAYEELTFMETRALIAMLQEALRKAEGWRAYEMTRQQAAASRSEDGER